VILQSFQNPLKIHFSFVELIDIAGNSTDLFLDVTEDNSVGFP
jgi:hypothetical protein